MVKINYLLDLGLRNMDINRPSSLGFFSVVATSAQASAKSISSFSPRLVCAISLPLKRTLTLTRLPSFKNFCALLALVLKSLVSILAHTDLLDFHDLLIFLGFLFTLLLIEAELGVVHNLADRGNSIGRDFYQIQALLLCHFIGFVGRHNAQLCAIFADDTNLLVPYFLIELMI